MVLFCLASGSILSFLYKPAFCIRKPRPALTCLVLAGLLGIYGEIAFAQAKTATGTTLAISSGGSPVSSVAVGTVVTLTAHVNADTAAVTPGQVNFCDASANTCTDIHLLGTAQLISAGTAVLKLRPGIGSHSYKAKFLGTTTNAASESSASALMATGTIPALATTTGISQTGSWGVYTLSATVTEPGNTAPPTGLVSFLDANHANAVLGTATLGGRRATWRGQRRTAVCPTLPP